MKRRIISIITALALCLSLCPTWAFAAEADPALCPHHREHTEDCGYTAPAEGQPCGHEHTAECYALEVLPDTESGDDYEIGADTENLLDCQHTHDSECGYAQADPGQPCGYECRICPIEALIAALPDKVTEDNAEDVRAQIDKILALFGELTEDEQEQIDLSRCYELQGALDGANDPAPITESVEYQEASWDGSEVTYTGKTENCTSVEGSTEAVTWNAGWYAVSGTVTISEPITVTGAVNLILTDGCDLTAAKGIVVTDGNSLTIYAQSKNGGTLNATGTTDDSGNASAGIGGSTSSVDSGSITIHGGIINATGGVANDNFGNPNYGGAGIGGSTTSSGNGGNSGTIEIYGGTITANSGEGSSTGAGIGGGGGGNGKNGGDGSGITIYGGNVTAASHGTQSGGAGIGGGEGNIGDGGAGNNIQINGGMVHATGGYLGAGIGGGGGTGGKSGDGTVTISGGTVTAVGGNYAAGIGGGGGHQNTYGGCTGGTGSVTINGGIVDASSPTDVYYANYKGAPIGNGGNASGGSVEKTTGIVFENGVGTVCGTVTFNGSYNVPADYSLNIPAGASLSGSGTLSGGNAFTTENLTEDMISVPEDLYYDGTDRTAELQNDLSAELNKGIEICGQTFTVSGWTLAVAKAADSDLTYTATYTNNNDNTNTFTKTITLQKSGTDLTSEGKVQTYKGDTLTKDFTASDTITVKATPTATGEAPANSAMFAASFTAPGAGQMAVFVGDTQVSAPVGAVDGTYTMTVSAADVLTKGQAGQDDKYTLIVKFVENTNMAGAEAQVEITITPNPLTADMVILSAESGTYSGTEQKPTVTVTGLTEGTDYEITYTGNFTSAGEHTLTVTGKGIYRGTVEKTYTIGKATPTIKWESWEVTVTYTGQPADVKPVITLVNGEKYTGEIYYSWLGVADSLILPTDAGSYGGVKARIPEQDNYNTAITQIILTLRIDPAEQTAPAAPTADEENIKDTSITLDTIENAEYKRDDGEWQESPTFTGLEPNQAYTFYARLKEDDNHNASPSSAGTSITTKKTMLNTAVVTVSGTYTYTGAAVVPEAGNVTVELNGTTINSDQYTISATGNVNAGTAKLTVTATENGSYSGSASTTFTISPATPTLVWSADNATQELPYTGNPAAITPPAVKLMGSDTFSGTITYSHAAQGGTEYKDGLPTNAGTYTIKASIAAQGNYTAADSTNTLTLTIKPTPVTLTFADQTIAYGDTPTGATADPASAKIEYSYTTGEGGEPISGWPTNAGTYTVTAKVEATGNYGGATATAQLTINKAPLTIAGATVASKPYDGTDTATVSGVTITGMVNGETLALGTDYTATGEFDSENAGTGKSVTVTVTLTSDKAKNYSLAQNTTTATSDITKASSTITTAPTASGITYGQALSDSALTDGEAVSGDTTLTGAWNWTAPATKPNAGTAQYEVTFTPSDTNYDTATVNVSVTVAKATPTLTAPTAGAIQYGQKLSDSTLTGGTATNPNGSAAVAGSWSWASGNTRPTATGTFPVAFVPGDTANYNTPGNVDASVTVNPAAPKITLTVPAYQVAGGEVTVTCKVENPHDATFKEGIPEAVTLTYTIGGETKPVDTDGKFTIPTGTAKDTVITVTASTATVDGKYTAATKTATVTVTDKIPVEISGVGVTGRAYNGKAIDHTGTPVIKTLNGEAVTDATVTYTWNTSDGTAPVNAGSYTLTISVGGEKYIGSTTVDFTIEKATVTITAANKSAVVGSAQPELTYTVSGLADGETLATAPTLTCTPDMNTVGSYPITASGAAVPNASNYNTEITYVAGTLSVTAKPSTGGGGYVPSGPGSSTITVPVSGDKSTVHVSASVSGTTATVSKIDTSQIENVIGDNGQASMVEIDFTGLGKTIDTVKLPAAAIKDIAAKAQNEEVGGLTVKLPEAEISFDANALSAIQAQAGSQITLTVTPAKPTDLNNRQKEAVGSAPVFDLTLRSSSGAITDFRGGYATVSLPYTLAAGQNPSGVVVYYLDSTGNITPCTTMYDVRSKSAIFTTGHLSLYFVGYDPAAVWVNPFSDVAEGAWYYDAVRFVSENGLMGGYGNGRFGPNDTLTRAQFAQILFNKEGRPVVNYLLQYGDAATGAWYTEAIRWATSQGVVGGYGNGMFGPNDNITREQLAVMLWRYAGSPAATEKELHFTDADKASGYALEALRWAVENGVMGGYGNGQLAPQGLATRAQVAQMLKNFLGK